MTQEQFKNILVQTGISTYHNIAQQEESKYIVWNLVGFKYDYADDYVSERVAIYDVNYYSTAEYDEDFLKIESVLEHNDLTFEAPKVIYDSQTNITLYSYNVEAVFNCG